MTANDAYEETLPKVFYALDELQHDHDHVDIATAAMEWAIEHLERANWSPQEIQTHLAQLLDPDPVGGNA